MFNFHILKDRHVFGLHFGSLPASWCLDRTLEPHQYHDFDSVHFKIRNTKLTLKASYAVPVSKCLCMIHIFIIRHGTLNSGHLFHFFYCNYYFVMKSTSQKKTTFCTTLKFILNKASIYIYYELSHE